MTSVLQTAGFSAPRAAAGHGRLEAFLRGWLGFTALLVLVMVTVGGATRLTGSGLSITEWKPITGAIPPLDAATWAAEFERYKQIPQYRLENAGMTLDAFKTLFWWEWSHRQLGRFIGLVYIAGFFAAIALGLRGKRLAILTGMGLLLGLQGLVGWIMVRSGLRDGMVAVEPVKLAAHLTLASAFLASLVAMLPARPSIGAATGAFPARLRATALALLVLVFLQIALGALVAGNRAGLVYNTWPLIDGVLVPPAGALFLEQPWWVNLLDNHLTVQFLHRMTAYLLFAVALLHLIDVRRLGRSALSRSSHMLGGLVLCQVALGVATLLLVVPLWAGLAHQALAMLVLAAAVWNVQVARSVRLAAA